MRTKNPTVTVKQATGWMGKGKVYVIKSLVGTTDYDIGQAVTEIHVQSMISSG